MCHESASPTTLAILDDHERFAFYHTTTAGIVYWRIMDNVVCLAETTSSATEITLRNGIVLVTFNSELDDISRLLEALTIAFDCC